MPSTCRYPSPWFCTLASCVWTCVKDGAHTHMCTHTLIFIWSLALNSYVHPQILLLLCPSTGPDGMDKMTIFLSTWGPLWEWKGLSLQPRSRGGWGHQSLELLALPSVIHAGPLSLARCVLVSSCSRPFSLSSASSLGSTFWYIRFLCCSPSQGAPYTSDSASLSTA